MTVVTCICRICETTVEANTCWCVIDSAKKTRHYECKKECRPKLKPPQPPQSKEEETRRPLEIDVEDWSAPRQTFFTWIQDTIGFGTARYIKVKTS